MLEDHLHDEARSCYVVWLAALTDFAGTFGDEIAFQSAKTLTHSHVRLDERDAHGNGAVKDALKTPAPLGTQCSSVDESLVSSSFQTHNVSIGRQLSRPTEPLPLDCPNSCRPGISWHLRRRSILPESKGAAWITKVLLRDDMHMNLCLRPFTTEKS